ncbi:MAG TPA: hypothetical protein VHP36_09660 [Chitinispirillaceae bacterium]|nr:hypothetical protein [Chitinispirillaceae bacterium]
MGKKNRQASNSSSKLKNQNGSSGFNTNQNNISMIEEFDFASENGPLILIQSLFPKGYQFPPAQSMSEEQLSKKLDEIIEILLAHNIDISFCEETPDKLIYNYLTCEIIPKEKIIEKSYKGCYTTFTGCDGACDTCFQKKYCEVEQEEQVSA